MSMIRAAVSRSRMIAVLGCCAALMQGALPGAAREVNAGQPAVRARDAYEKFRLRASKESYQERFPAM